MIYFLGYTLKSFRGGFTSLVDHLPDSLAKRGGAKSQSSLGTFQIPETMNVGLTIVLSQEAGESQGTCRFQQLNHLNGMKVLLTGEGCWWMDNDTIVLAASDIFLSVSHLAFLLITFTTDYKADHGIDERSYGG